MSRFMQNRKKNKPLTFSEVNVSRSSKILIYQYTVNHYFLDFTSVILEISFKTKCIAEHLFGHGKFGKFILITNNIDIHELYFVGPFSFYKEYHVNMTKTQILLRSF